MLRIRVFLSGIALILLVGCSEGASDHVMSAKDASDALQAGHITLVDIRRPDEWRQTGVPAGATLINMVHPQGANGFAQAVLQATGNDYDAPVVLICRTGNRSSRLVPILKEMGFTNVSHVPEGMVGSTAGPGWIAQGLSVTPCPNC